MPRSESFELVASDLEGHGYDEDIETDGLVRFVTYRNRDVVTLDSQPELTLEDLVRSAISQGAPREALPNSLRALERE